VFELSVILLLAWGVLAFGSPYAWAYSALLVFSLVPTLLGFRASPDMAPPRRLTIGLAAIFLAGVAQVVVPAHVVPRGWQPGASADFRQLYEQIMLQPMADWPLGVLSVAPSRTILGLVFLATFGLMLTGLTKGLSAVGPKRVVRGVVVLGTLVAFIGLIQQSAHADATYGFWLPLEARTHFAPFTNRNHFAGWMAMTMSLSMGSFAGALASALDGKDLGWRERVIWLSSPQATEILLTVVATAIMALSIVMTFSRGGLIALATVVLVGSSWMIGRQRGMRRFVIGVSMIVMLILAATWGGADVTIERFQGAAADLGGRKAIWKDTLRIIHDYPVTGTGLNTLGIAMLHYQTWGKTQFLVTEAHNDYLHLAAEGGLLLGIPILATLMIFALTVHRRFVDASDDLRTYWIRAGAVTGLCAIAVLEMFDFTLQMPGAAAAFVVLAAIAIHRPAELNRSTRSRRIPREKRTTSV
jgi:O-antigen ligase